uniref:Uncharacterized protein n=1 Tax=Anguilla anguilla TaxID=7936 RepID=A0A0E9VZ17_ANGAN
MFYSEFMEQIHYLCFQLHYVATCQSLTRRNEKLVNFRMQ